MSRYKYKLNGIIRDTETNLTYNIDDIVKLLNEQDNRIRELKQELVESEKTIEDLEVELSMEKQYRYRDVISLIDSYEKDKIEFAIEQLEKFKDYIVKNGNDVGKLIDEQIEELKKE